MTVVLRAKRKHRSAQIPQKVSHIEVRCEFTELFTTQCAHCLGIEADWLPKPKKEVYEGADYGPKR